MANPKLTGPRPEWLKIRIRANETFDRVTEMVSDLSLHTVCQEARCPNIFECWSEGTATFMILGDVCTRHCGFCAVGKGKPLPLDPAEPRHVGEAVRRLGVKHAVVTSVNRDELPDGGSIHFAETIRWIRRLNPHTRVEVLIPDFCGNEEALSNVLSARPDVLNHNTETVPRLYKRVRPDARFEQSLKLLRTANGSKGNWPLLTKTGLMVGLGETTEELLETFRDLAKTGCDILTVGQYLAPTARHIPIEKYYSPEEFNTLRDEALTMGFRYVEAGPLVRSSYHAGRHTEHAQQHGYSDDPIFAIGSRPELLSPPTPLVQIKARRRRSVFYQC
ncbi:MAG TPA: lipoyl synthase [Blastocatellia bacterium]|nr:lipoyl synthase [Blastocatellia bacterium]